MNSLKPFLVKHPVDSTIPAWELVSRFQAQLAFSLTDEHSQCAPDVDDRITAYFDLAWLQQQLISATGRCSHQSSDYFQNPIECNHKSVAFCQSCGQELCREHIERANCATVCEHCKRGTN